MNKIKGKNGIEKFEVTTFENCAKITLTEFLHTPDSGNITIDEFQELSLFVNSK